MPASRPVALVTGGARRVGERRILARPAAGGGQRHGRARATAPGSTSKAASTSASTLLWPRDSRSEPRALTESAPIAISTCDGWVTPAVQAEPVEHSIPLASNSINRASPSQPRNVKCALPGSRSGPRAPLSRTSSISASTPSTRRSRNTRSRSPFACTPSTAIRAAVAMPASLVAAPSPKSHSIGILSSAVLACQNVSATMATPLHRSWLRSFLLFGFNSTAAITPGMWRTASKS